MEGSSRKSVPLQVHNGLGLPRCHFVSLAEVRSDRSSYWKLTGGGCWHLLESCPSNFHHIEAHPAQEATIQNRRLEGNPHQMIGVPQ